MQCRVNNLILTSHYTHKNCQCFGSSKDLNMRTILAIIFMTFASLASADTTDEKLDLILKKLEVIEETYSKFLKATETLNGIFPEGSFEDEKITPNDEGHLENAVAAALEEIDSKIDKEAIEIPNKEYLKVVNWTAKDLGTRLGAVGKVIEI